MCLCVSVNALTRTRLLDDATEHGVVVNSGYVHVVRIDVHVGIDVSKLCACTRIG